MWGHKDMNSIHNLRVQNALLLLFFFNEKYLLVIENLKLISSYGFRKLSFEVLLQI